jgi:transcriptional regulator with XRE-family HTH domain
MKLHLGNLHAALDAGGLDQKGLADKAGWSEAKASRLLNGITKDVTMTMVKELEQALGVSAAYLLDLEDVAQTDEEREILRNYRAAQARDREIAKAALKPAKG